MLVELSDNLFSGERTVDGDVFSSQFWGSCLRVILVDIIFEVRLVGMLFSHVARMVFQQVGNKRGVLR